VAPAAINSNIANNTFLINSLSGQSGAATGIGVRLTKSTNGGTLSNVALQTKSTGGYGTLLSGSTVSGPLLKPSDFVTLTAELVRGQDNLKVGNFTASVPLTVYYK
jgi:type 1 fimbria pilin